MLFNSFEYAIFLPVVFIIYWFITNRSLRLQNLTILTASYFFYGWWDWRFLSLIIFSTVVDFMVGQGLMKTDDRMTRKMWLWLSIIVNLGLLGVFKYYNFFLDSLYNAAPGLQAVMGFNTLSIILPVGISFYTFQTLSYTIDIYKRKLEPTNDFIAFAAYVAFFPQLVAGPIERATNLLPQFKKERVFNYTAAVDGMRQILWGLFKKIVIADNSAVFANEIFANSESYSGSVLLFGALFFAIQIYGDFSGYSDIAIGTARLFGFNLMRNFAFPYFSRDIAEFWRRWHISLSTWFRDYLYIPLGGSRGGRGMQIRNIFVIFIVSGFWHGANWTFIAWGALHAIFFLPLLLTKKNRSHMDIAAKGKLLPSLKELMGMAVTFTLVLLAWVFFRAEDLGHAFSYLGGMFSSSLFTVPSFHDSVKALTALILISVFIIVEWLGREREYAIAGLDFRFKKPVRYAIYYAIVLVIFWAGGQGQQFIYFQF
jgi:alginate O-acetyltransferase complex protein AlgI